MNPLEASIRLAAATNQDIYDLYAKAGDKNNADGFVMEAYRTARMAMREALEIDRTIERMRAVNDISSVLFASVVKPMGEMFTQAQNQGMNNAREHLLLYQNNVPDKFDKANAAEMHNSAVEAIWTKINDQTVLAQAVAVGGLDEALIIGDETHVGALRASDITGHASFWVAALFWAAFEEYVRFSPGGGRYMKQAVAALDNRTTSCCLHVHGQVQPFDNKFKLEGSPKFADELDWAPFHWYCRTSVALYLPQYDDGFSDRLRESAQTVLNERASGIFVDRHPASAFV